MKKEFMVSPIDFLFVDDDPLSNLISGITVDMILGKVNSRSFTNPEAALQHLTSAFFADNQVNKIVLFLDINMPGMSGWEFLERFDNMDVFIKNLIHIYILSSSVDDRDKLRSYANKNVIGFLVKPLTKETILQVIADWQSNETPKQQRSGKTR